MIRRFAGVTLLAASLAAPASAAEAPRYETPQDAIRAVKRVVKRTATPCGTDWARIQAVGFEGAWKVEVRIRGSEAGEGLARWRIGGGWPRAANALARALARGCPAGE